MKVKDIVGEAGLSYKGYPCTQDCSGHIAGYRWAANRDISDEDECPYRPTHPSFWEGCKSKAEGK